MKTTTIALLGTCLILAAYGKPILQSLKNSGDHPRASRDKREDSVGRSFLSSVSSEFKSDTVYNRPYSYSDKGNYYEAFEIVVQTSGSYVFNSDSELDTMGYIYDGAFDPSQPDNNLILDDDDSHGDLQFSIDAFLDAGRVYVLVITTHGSEETGGFTIVVDGPESVTLNSFAPSTSLPITAVTSGISIVSSVVSELSAASGVFNRVDGQPGKGYHFESFEISVETSDVYVFTSDSESDLLGFLYEGVFDPSQPTENLLTYDDDGHGSYQFSVEAYLEAGQAYVLVVTTHGTFETGSFSIQASGPTVVSLHSFTPATSLPLTGLVTEAPILSSISGALSAESGTFNRIDGSLEEGYYYQALEVTVQTNGIYTFSSKSNMDTLGFFYFDSFDPSEPEANLITYDDDGSHDYLQFSVEAFLETEHKYVLVITTHGGFQAGDFSVSVGGPDNANLQVYTPVTSRPIVVATTPVTVLSSFASQLSEVSGHFIRPDGDSDGSYYYQTFHVVAPVSGMYYFTSQSSFDTMGYLYDSSFDPSEPIQNLIMEDDDGGDEYYQFGFNVFLQAEHPYILVVTTHQGSLAGSFSVSSKGPASIIL